MQVTMNSHLQVSRHYWWSILLRGVLAVLFGIATLLWPGLTLLLLLFFFGTYALVDGVVTVFVSLQERKNVSQWWIFLIEGLLSIAFGLLTFAWPAITALILLYLVALWAISTGLFEIAAAFAQRQSHGSLGWTLAIAGIISVVFGVLLVSRPGSGLLSLIWLMALYAFMFGILLITRAFQFRAFSREFESQEPLAAR